MPNSANTAIIQPDRIVQLTFAYMETKTMLSAAELGVFTHLGQGPATAAQLQKALGLHPRPAADFLDSLVALNLLTRDGDSYRNGPEADLYLVPGKRTYLGGYLQFISFHLWPVWSQLTEMLRTGEPQYVQVHPEGIPEETNEDGDAFFDRMGTDLAEYRAFVETQDAFNTPIAVEVAKRFDWGSRRNLVDLGGARGNLSALVAEAHPNLTATVFDLPPLEPLFTEHIKSLGLADRIRFHAGDFLADPLPEGDVLLFGHVLHNWAPQQREMLIKKAYDALAPGGVLLVYDLMIDDTRSAARPLILSLHMMLAVTGGSEYTAGECREWMTRAGFTGIETVTLDDLDHTTLLVAHKPD